MAFSRLISNDLLDPRVGMNLYGHELSGVVTHVVASDLTSVFSGKSYSASGAFAQIARATRSSSKRWQLLAIKDDHRVMVTPAVRAEVPAEVRQVCILKLCRYIDFTPPSRQ